MKMTMKYMRSLDTSDMDQDINKLSIENLM